MDTIITILNSLKIDSTAIIQFILFVVFFNLIAPILFKRMQDVLDLRESKTTKLDSSANHIYKQAEDLEVKYKGTIEKTHQDSQVLNSKKKAEVMAKEKSLLDSEEEKISADYESKRTTLLSEVAAQRATVLAEAEKLSSSLVDKLTK